MSERPAPNLLTLRTVLDAWRGITGEEIVTTFLLGCGLWLYHILGSVLTSTPSLAFRPSLIHFIADQIKAFALLLAFVVAERATGQDPERRSPYALAIVVGVAAGMVEAVTTLSLLFHAAECTGARFPHSRSSSTAPWRW